MLDQLGADESGQVRWEKEDEEYGGNENERDHASLDVHDLGMEKGSAKFKTKDK